ncbi:MFS transporter [Micromonospora sp. NBC_01699]|uniref:MFS transporter n=1 Tax=Micromonospora sp. NBC_01699 TaxID=2975984 RepID=UPI002E2AD835|nr:MFS transporter [Micromonospora sp. NBC_01699]
MSGRSAAGGRPARGWRAWTGAQRFLLASSFLIPLGSFAVLPFMSVLLHQRLGLGLGVVGAVLAVAALVQFAGGIVGAAVAERIGLQRTMLLALVIRTVGFAAFVPGLDRPPAAIAALVLTSCGAALYLPANKAYLIHRVAPDRRPGLLAASGSALNAGIALGPLAAGPFVLNASAPLFAVVTGLFAVVTIGHARLPVEDGTEPGRTEREPVDRPRRVLAEIPALPFAITTVSVYLFMFFQHFLAVYAVPRTSAGYYGAVLTAYAAVIVVVQPLLAGWIGRLSHRAAMRIGFTAMGGGMAALAAGHPVAILGGALLVCLGEVVLFLKNELTALAASTRPPAVVFGQLRLAAGIGAFASGIVGGAAYQYVDRLGRTPLFWLAVAAQCLLLPLLVGMLAGRGARTPADPQPPAGDGPGGVIRRAPGGGDADPVLPGGAPRG